MRIRIISTVIFLVFFIGILFPFFENTQAEKEYTAQVGWSSVDKVFFNVEKNILIRKPGSGPVRIGYTSKRVQKVMGVPDSIDKERHIFYYRHSPIYFDSDWKVQSWDNRYGNLYVLKDIPRINPGSHILEVFEKKGLPISIKKINKSYQFEYPDEMVYISASWLVEGTQPRQVVKYNKERTAMSLENFLDEFEKFITKNPSY